MTDEAGKITAEKIALFRQLFTGLTNAYGTYNPTSGRVRQVKAPVTDQVILSHLKGEQPYGVYLLVKGRSRAIAVDFDSGEPLPAIEFINRAKHYGIPAYIERSKSKGYHAWMFFENNGVFAAKARLVMNHILQEINQPDTEIFPKHDALNTDVRYGNFINAPLFGTLVPKGRTVFVDPDNSMKPFPDQWKFLEKVQRVTESVLDTIIESKQLCQLARTPEKNKPTEPSRNHSSFGLLPCARQMLEGVAHNQRVVCFRLAVHLKRLGLPYDIAVGALKAWSLKNSPGPGRQIITEHEIHAQAASAYNKHYRSYGCENRTISAYCQNTCPLHTKKQEP
jgi:hypothetical protein